MSRFRGRLVDAAHVPITSSKGWKKIREILVPRFFAPDVRRLEQRHILDHPGIRAQQLRKMLRIVGCSEIALSRGSCSTNHISFRT